MKQTIDTLFTEGTVRLASGAQLTIPNALVAAPMEANPVTKIPFMSTVEVERKSPDDIRLLCDQLLGDKDWLVANYDYKKGSDVVGVGNGIPSPLTFHKIYAQARGGWGLVFVEATSYRIEHAARKRGLLLNEDTLPYHRKIVAGFRHFAADPGQKIMIQLSHAGWCAQKRRTFRNVFAQGANPPTDEEITRALDDIRRAAALAAEAGYDGVDIKLCHGYGLADWTLEKVRGSNHLDDVARALHEAIPLIPLFKTIRREAGRADFAVGYRFSFFEGIANGWGARFDPSFEGELARDESMAFYDIQRDDRLSTWTVQAFTQYTDFVHSSLGIPALTPELTRGTRRGNRSSIVDHLETANAIYRAMGKVDGERNIPVIVSNLTTGGQAVLYLIAKNRAERVQPGYVSMGRGSIVNFDYPVQLRDNGRSIRYCSTCMRCISPLLHQETPSGCIYDPPIKTISRYYQRNRKIGSRERTNSRRPED